MCNSNKRGRREQVVICLSIPARLLRALEIAVSDDAADRDADHCPLILSDWLRSGSNPHAWGRVVAVGRSWLTRFDTKLSLPSDSLSPGSSTWSVMARLNQVLSQTPAASSPRSDEPSSAPSSDKENQSASAARDKTNARMPQATRPSKRPRLQAQSSIVAADDEEYDELRYYNPAQDQHERQEVKKRSRALERELYGA